MRASRNFEGTAWVSYDAAFRRQAAIHGSFDWGVIDPTLYNEAFTGRARIKARCSHCLSDTHGSRSCPLAPEDWQLPRQEPDAPSTSSGGIPLCGLFNSTKGNSCHYSDCRYTHICSNCRWGSHPASHAHRCRGGSWEHSNWTDPKPPDMTAGWGRQHYVANLIFAFILHEQHDHLLLWFAVRFCSLFIDRWEIV